MSTTIFSSIRTRCRGRALAAIAVVAVGGTSFAGCATGAGAPTAAVSESAATPVIATERIGEHLLARQIQERVWVVTHEVPMPANSLLAVSDDATLLLVDTPWTPSATDELLRWAVERLGGTKIEVVNSHFHFDALGGNAALRDGGVGARGLSTTRQLLAERGEDLRRGLLESLDESVPAAVREELATMPLVYPAARYMASEFTHRFGSERYVIVYPGPAHSPDNVAVWLPERGVLFGGCMVKGGGSLGFLGDADVASWPEAIRVLQALEPEIVVPGHGDRLDPGLLSHTLSLLAEQSARDDPGG